MPDLGPSYPPPGTTLPELLADWVGAMQIGLYQGTPTVCPPPAYSTIQQPSFPGYSTVPITWLGQQPVFSGPGLTAQRLAARFFFAPGIPSTTVDGWFVFVTLRDASQVVILVRPFPAPVTFGGADPPPPAQPIRQLLVEPTLTVAPGIGAGGVDVVVSDAPSGLSFGGRMAFVFRGDQRRAIKRLRNVLARIAAWDANIGNLSQRSLLARYPISLNVPSALEQAPGPPPVYYTGNFLANVVSVQLLADLSLTAPSSPP